MQESKGEKLSLEIRFPGSPPKCSTPRMTKPAKFEIRLDHLDTSSSSSCDDSLQSVRSVSSIYSLLNGKFGSAYKKTKIRQKVEAVMGSVESLCLEQGETLGTLLHKATCFSVRKLSVGSMGRSSSFGICLVKQRTSWEFERHSASSYLRSCGTSVYK